MLKKYRKQLADAKNKTQTFAEILGDDTLTDEQVKELADYLQKLANDEQTKVYEAYKKQKSI